jgi:hypothetical protein
VVAVVAELPPVPVLAPTVHGFVGPPVPTSLSPLAGGLMADAVKPGETLPAGDSASVVPPPVLPAADAAAGPLTVAADHGIKAPKAATGAKLQPLTAVSPAGKPVIDPRDAEPPAPAAPAHPEVIAMPGSPVINNSTAAAPGEPVMVGMEKDAGSTRMAGMTPLDDPAPSGDDDEGLRSFRMTLEERLRMVPQPPAVSPNRDRRPPKKAL